MLPFNASRQGGTMTLPPYTKPLNRENVTLPPCRVLPEAGKIAFPPYGEPFGFFARFLPPERLDVEARQLLVVCSVMLREAFPQKVGRRPGLPDASVGLAGRLLLTGLIGVSPGEERLDLLDESLKLHVRPIEMRRLRRVLRGDRLRKRRQLRGSARSKSWACSALRGCGDATPREGGDAKGGRPSPGSLYTHVLNLGGRGAQSPIDSL